MDALGFLSVKRHAEHGYFGGYLVLNLLARPLEFHCTLPVKATRAQELLYGPTLDDFICGEQIAKALVTKAKLKPKLVITDTQSALALANVDAMNIAMLQFDAKPLGEGRLLETPKSHLDARPVSLGTGENFRVPFDSTLTKERIEEDLKPLAANFELAEPFQRICEALLEAHPIAKAA